jgi:hypothetical protein
MGVAVVAGALMLVTGCAKEAKQAVSASGDESKATAYRGDPESAYCRLTIKREAAQIRQNMHPFKPESPELVQSELDYVEFVNKGDMVSPSAIKAPFHAFAAWYTGTLAPTVRKYGYDEGRFDREATAADTKLVEQPANVEKAFGQVVRYEHDVCAIGEPIAADVKFTGSSKSPYCVDVRGDQAANEKWFKSGFTMEENRAYFTGLVRSLDAEDGEAAADDAMPASIRAGIHKHAVNARTKAVPVLAKYDYDVARLIEEGTTAERRVFTGTGADLRNVLAREAAYNEQVCKT